MKILITGGAGFIGSHLCERFVSDGHSVLCVDNLLTGREANVDLLRREARFQFVRQDVTLAIPWKGSLDYVLHLASPASPPDYLRYPLETLKVGSVGTWNALELARASGAQFLMASTSEVYGDPEIHPQPESYWGRVNPVGPRSVYDEAKRFSEALTMAYHRTHGVDTRIARIFNSFGPRMRKEDGRAIPNFIMQALEGRPLTLYGEGTQTRSFCFVTDLVEGICRLMQVPLHEPVNLGNPVETTLRDLAQIILRLTGSQSPLEFHPLPQDDPRVRRPDIRLATERLAWKPKVSLEQGLRSTIDWFRQTP